MPITTAERAERTYTHRGYRMGMHQGFEKGIEKGERAKALETARNLLAMDIPIEKISLATGLTEDEIHSL